MTGGLGDSLSDPFEVFATLESFDLEDDLVLVDDLAFVLRGHLVAVELDVHGKGEGVAFGVSVVEGGFTDDGTDAFSGELGTVHLEFKGTGHGTVGACGGGRPIPGYICGEAGKGHGENREDESGHAHSVAELTGANQP